jgi:hypothetical protein
MAVLGQLYAEAQNLRRFYTIFPKVSRERRPTIMLQNLPISVFQDHRGRWTITQKLHPHTATTILYNYYIIQLLYYVKNIYKTQRPGEE